MSRDGVHFTLEPEPVIYPADYAWRAWEWPGGCEDPRVVESPDGGFVCLCTAFDGKSATLFGRDLARLPRVAEARSRVRRYAPRQAVVEERIDRDGVPRRPPRRARASTIATGCIGVKVSASPRLRKISFAGSRLEETNADPRPVRQCCRRTGFRVGAVAAACNALTGTRALRPLLFPRPGRFDSLLVEPGPPRSARSTASCCCTTARTIPAPAIPRSRRSRIEPGQVLFDRSDPSACIARGMHPFLAIDANGASAGPVDNVCFAQSLVQLDGLWVLYFGMADSRIGAATAPVA